MIGRSKLTFNFLVVGIILSFLSSPLAANTQQKSIQWQKYELENSLKNRISNVVKQVVEKDKFFVEVQVEAKVPSVPVPEFSLMKPKRNKLSNKKNQQSLSDAILFDKLGLNAPLYEGNYDQRNSDLQLKIFQYSKRVEREFNSKMDLFSNIESVKVKIGLDKSVNEATTAEVKKLVESVMPKFGEVVPVIETFAFQFKLKKVKKETFADKWSAMLGPAGMIIATLILSLSAFFLFFMYRKMRNETEQKQESENAEAKESKQEAALPSVGHKVDPDLRPGSSQLADAISETTGGINRYCLYLEKSFEQAANLVKKWIHLNSRISSTSVAILSERLSVDELYQLFMKLSTSERFTFQKMSQLEISVADITEAEKYIARQVLEDILNVNAVVDKDLQSLLVELTPEKAAEIVSVHVEEGAYLINLVNGEFLGRMFEHLDVEKSKVLTERALSLKEEDLNVELSSLKLLLEEKSKSTYKSPFVNRIVEFMNNLDFAKSEALIDTLVELKHFDIIEDVIRTSFPSRLIDRIPANLIKKLFKEMNLQKKTILLASFDEDRRTEYLDKATQAGTKGRELIEFELTRLLDNEDTMSEINDKKEEIFSEFVVKVHQMIKTDEESRTICQSISAEWLAELKDETGPSLVESAA